MKSLDWLFRALLADASRWCGTDSTSDKDLSYIRGRVKHEGSSFITITLPTFSEALERGLEEGCWRSPLGFAVKQTRRGQLSLPAFLLGLTGQVFDPKTGTLLEAPSVNAIYAIRQITRVASKVFMLTTSEREKRALEGYLNIEEHLRHGLHSQKPEMVTADVSRVPFRQFCRNLYSGVAARAAELVRSGSLSGRHGPGATADRLSGNQKFDSKMWYERWSWFPPDHHWYINHGDWVDSHQDLHVVKPNEEPPVRVLFVPKTQKTPRVIAMEPTPMQFLQQGLGRALMDLVESDSLTAGKINFVDQSINQEVARRASVDRRLATLDLSEASDRVSCKLVWDLFDGAPELREAVFQLRSTRALLPGGKVVALRKFASMGSALCFPVEAMAFFAIVLYARHCKYYGARGAVTRRRLARCARDVYVYGDDIIVPVDEVPEVIDTLHSFGMKVNTAKSFWNGYFRESCGGDYYQGVPVRPVLLRREFPNDLRRVTEVISWISSANQFYSAGWWVTAQAIRDRIERITGSLPTVGYHDVSYLSWTSVRPCRTFHGWDTKLQTFAVRGLVPVPLKRKDKIDGYPALRKALLPSRYDSRGYTAAFSGSEGVSFALAAEEQARINPGNHASDPGSACWSLSERLPHVEDIVAGGDRASTSSVGRKPDDQLFDWSSSAARTSVRVVETDKEHLFRSVRPGAVALRRRWKPA